MRTLSLRRLSSHGSRLLKRALSPEPRGYDDEGDDDRTRYLRSPSSLFFSRLDAVSCTFPIRAAAELKVLHDSALGASPTVDIVAVHGLGNGFEGWESTEDGLCWLTSLLHHDIPTARIMTFQHSPDLLTPNLAVREALYERAQSLLSALKQMYSAGGARDPANGTPPLVFLSHSLGGLIVQRALVMAKESQDPATHRVYLATRGMVYFGVPARDQLKRVLGDVSHLLHTRTSSAGPATAARRARARDGKDGRDGRDGKGWAVDAASLEAGLKSFDEIADRLHAMSVCFCEALPTPGLKGQMVVDIGSTTSAAERILLQRSHVDLMRFDSHEDDGYLALREWLNLMLAGAISPPPWLAPGRASGASNSDGAAAAGTSSATSSLQTLADPLQAYDEVPFLRFDFDIRPEYPSPPPYHVRHGLLEELGARFEQLSRSSRVACVALVGYEDVGKGFIAQHFARLTSKAGDRPVFWLNGSSRETLSISYLELGRAVLDYYWAKHADTLMALGDDPAGARVRLRAALGLADLDSLLDGRAFLQLDQVAVAASIKAVINWLLREGNDRWLLVLDNVGDVSDLIEFLPLTLNGWILLVPQKRDFEIGILGMGRLEVPAWTEDEAYELLLAETGREHHPSEEQAGFDIVHSLDYRPSLICHTAAYIRERGASFHNYYSTDALATLALASLEEHPRRDQMADVLGVACLLSDTPIPLDLLISIENAVGARLSTDAGGAWWVGGPATALTRQPRLTETLKTLDLITQTSCADVGYLLPPTIRAHFLQTPTPRHAWLALVALSSAIHRQTLFDSPTLPELHALSRPLLPHARALYPLALQLSDANFVPDKRDPKRVDWHLFGQLAATQGDSTLAIKWLEFTLHRGAARPEDERLDPVRELETVLSLAQLYRHHGDFSRYGELLRSAVVTDDMRYNVPDLYFRARLARATLFAEKSILDHAAFELEDLARLYTPSYDEDYGVVSTTLHSSNGLARTATRTTAHTSSHRNRTSFRNSHRSSRISGSGNNHNHSHSISGGGNIFAQLSRPRHILALHSLAVILRMAGRLDDASAAYARLHPLYASHLGPAHPTVLDTLEEHAHALQDTLHMLDAVPVLERTLTAKTASLGPKHPSVLLAQAHLAALRQTLLNYDAADSLYRTALPAMEEHLGESHEAYLGAKENLALSFWARADATDAAAEAVVAATGGVRKRGGDPAVQEMRQWAIGLMRDVLRVREDVGMGIEAEATRERLEDMMTMMML